VLVTPYMGVKMLPAINAQAGGLDAIYATKNYQRLHRLIRACVDHKSVVTAAAIGVFALSAVGMRWVNKQFFPNSDRPELTIEVNLPPGSAFEATDRVVRRIEEALAGILIRNTLILVDQIHHDKAAGLPDYDAIIESTVRRARPVVLTAVAAMLAFIQLLGIAGLRSSLAASVLGPC
jgi:multidrug efflux pump subunit AcrB